MATTCMVDCRRFDRMPAALQDEENNHSGTHRYLMFDIMEHSWTELQRCFQVAKEGLENDGKETLSEEEAAPTRKARGTEIDEEEDWATSDEVAEDDSDSNAVVAESALDRMACGLGGKTMFPHILTATPQMLQQVNYMQGTSA